MTTRSRWLRAAVLPIGMVILLAVGGCTVNASAPPADAPSATPAPPAEGSAAACVPDPGFVVAQENTQSLEPVPADVASQYDAAASAVFERVKEVAPAVIVAVRSPEGSWSAAYGTADLVAETPASADMHFRMASVTKSFVGTVILQLAEQGRLSLDDPIDDYVPGVPNGTRITLRELITMTSGLGNYSDDPEWGLAMLADPEAEWDPEQLLEYSWSMPTSFAPGSDMEYSNVNFVLLGLVVEQVTGTPLPEYIQTQLLDPLELGDTTYPTDNSLPAPRVNGYTLPAVVTDAAGASNIWVDATEWSPSSAGAAGAMTTTLDDLLVWGRALATGQGVLSEQTQVERLQSFGSSMLGPGEFYGEAIVCRDGWIGHNGNIPGYNTMMRYHPVIDTTIVVDATGLSGSSTPPRELVIEQLMGALAGVTDRSFTAHIVPPEAQFQALVPQL